MTTLTLTDFGIVAGIVGSTVIPIVGGAAGIASKYMSNRLQLMEATFAKWRAEDQKELAEARLSDFERMERWVNGSFMRANVVQTNVDGIHKRLDRMEHKIDGSSGRS